MNEAVQPSTSKALRVYTPVPRQMANWVRKADLARTINDLVEDIHTVLVDKSPEYVGYLDAVYDEQAVEGSLATDNTLAAMLIRDEAKKRNVPRVADAKLATIVKALNIVLRRYGVSRNERRNMVVGEIVNTGNGD
jgi:hypothetical protein